MSGKGWPTRHGGKTWLKHGILPKGKKYIARQVDSLMAEMVKDLGGEAEVTAAQRVLLSVIRQDLIYLALVSEWANAQASIITRKGEVLGALGGFFLAAQNTVTRNCRELGLRRISIADNLEEYLAKKSRQAALQGESPPARPSSQGRGKSKVCARSEAQGGGE